MRRSKRSFTDAKSPLVERFSLTVLSLRLVDFGKIVEAGGHFEMVWTEGCFTQNQQTLIQRFGLLRLILRTIDYGQGGKRNDQASLGEAYTFCFCQRRSELLFCFSIKTLLIGLYASALILLPHGLLRAGERRPERQRAQKHQQPHVPVRCPNHL